MEAIQPTPAAIGEKIAQLQAKASLTMAEQTELDRLTGDEVIDPQAELAESARIVEIESKKAAPGKNGQLKVNAAEEVKRVRESKSKFARHLILDIHNGTYTAVADAAARDEWARKMELDPERYEMVIVQKITPTVTVEWK